MVKRIKKRIPKQDDATAGGVDLELEEGAEPPKPDLAAELAAVADEDGFTRRTAGALKWVVERKNLFIGMAVIALVGVGVYMFMQRSSAAGAEEASAAFFAGAKPYIEAHRGGPEAPEATARRTSIERAKKEFESTRSQYGDRRVAALATLGLAGAEFDLGNFDGAITLYDEFLGKPDTDPFARSLAMQGKAAALEAKGDLSAAQEAWKAVEGLDPKAYGLMAGVSVGRLLEKQKKTADAKAHYERLKKDYADALGGMTNRALKAEIDRRLSALGEAS